MAGATLGGATGQGYGELVGHLTELPGAIADVTRNLVNPETRAATLGGFGEGAVEGAQRALRSGAIQGGLEAAGVGAGKALERPARWFMNAAVRPGIRVAKDTGQGVLTGPGRTISAQFPQVDIIGELLRRRIPVRNAGLRSTDTAATAAANARNAALTEATSAGAMGTLDNIVDPLLRSADEIAEGAVNPRQASQYRKFIDEYFDANPAQLPISRMEAQKESAQATANFLKEAKQKATRARFNTDIAGTLKSELERTVDAARSTGATPLAALNRETQTQMAMREALLAALNRESQSGRFTTGGLLDNPRLWGAIAQGTGRLATAAPHVPNVGRATLLAMMASH